MGSKYERNNWHFMYLSFKLPNGKVIEGNVAKTAVTIGRSNKADFVVPDDSLSRTHCLIELQDSRFYITDLASANGVFVDGNRIPTDQKIPFTTFMQLAVGPIEFTVQEESDQLTLEQPHRQQHSSDPTATKTAQSSKQRAPSRMRKSPAEKTPSSVNPKLLGVFLLMAMGGLYYVYKGDNIGHDQVADVEQNESQIQQPLVAQTIINSKVADEFYSPEFYQNLESKRSCSGKNELCKEFKLNEEEDGEGIVFQDSEAFVFMKPSSFFELSHLSFLKEQPNGEEIISHYVVLTSSLMAQLSAREIDQVHLIMLDDAKKMVKVFRYHILKFNEGNNNRYQYIEFLNNAFLTRKLDEVTTLLQKEIPSKDLNTK